MIGMMGRDRMLWGDGQGGVVSAWGIYVDDGWVLETRYGQGIWDAVGLARDWVNRGSEVEGLEPGKVHTT